MNCSDAKKVGSTKKVLPTELISSPKMSEEHKISEDLILKVKEDLKYNDIIKGSALGLTSYLKPTKGIPYSDLSEEVQEVLDKVNLDIIELLFKSSAAAGITRSDILNWNSKPDIDELPNAESNNAVKSKGIVTYVNNILQGINRNVSSNSNMLSGALRQKQDRILDLDSIRQGAILGAAAVLDENYVHTDNNYTNEEKEKLSLLSNYDDSSVVGRLETLENADTQITTLKTINNESLTGEGNIWIPKPIKKPIVHRCIPLRPLVGNLYYFEHEVLIKLRASDFETIDNLELEFPLSNESKVDVVFYNNNHFITYANANDIAPGELITSTFFEEYDCDLIILRIHTGNRLITINESMINQLTKTLDLQALFNYLDRGSRSDEIVKITSDTVSPLFKIVYGKVKCIAETSVEYVKDLLKEKPLTFVHFDNGEIELKNNQIGIILYTNTLLDGYYMHAIYRDDVNIIGKVTLPSAGEVIFTPIFPITKYENWSIHSIYFVHPINCKYINKKLSFFYKVSGSRDLARSNKMCRLHVETGSKFMKSVKEVRKKVRNKYISSVPLKVLFVGLDVDNTFSNIVPHW